MKKTLSVILALCAAALMAAAQPSIRVQVPNIVAVDEQFNVNFIIEGEKSPSDFSWTPGPDFQLVWGPQKGTSSSISVINGKTTRSSQTTYTYILLPKSTGKFTLAAATARIKDDTISSGSVQIEVVSNGARPSAQQQGSSSSQGQSRPQSQGQAAGDIPASDLFLRLTLSRSSVVVGEPVTATLKLYHRVNIAGFEDVKFPTFNGFWSQELQAPSNIEFHRENIDDNIYNAAVLRSWVIIPQQAGDITIDPSEIVCLVNVRTQSTSRSIFDSFFEDDYRTLRKRAVSDRCRVHVSALPAGAPASFGGGVGQYGISAKLSKDELKTHDAASLLVTVTGKGNVSLLEAPHISFPPDFDVYDVKVTDGSDKSSGKTSGSKTFEYPFIPRSHGDFTIDPVEYTYYDVNAHKYVTLTTQPLSVSVAKGAEDAVQQVEGQVVQGVSRRDVRNLGSDIRYIVTGAPSLSRAGRMFCFSPLFWCLTALLVLLAASLYLLLRSLAARRSDVVLTRHRGATKMARRRLARAGEFLQKDLYTAFYEELHKALLGYVSDKLNIDMSEMSKDNISASLQSAGASGQLASDFNELLDACEFARYAPASGHEAMNAHYESALSVISAIDASMKKKSGAPLRGAVSALLLLLTLSIQSRAAGNESSLDSLWTEGVEAYAQGQWDAALSAWQGIVDAGMQSADLYYNLGNACFKSGDIAHAIIWYERALRLNPSSSDVRFNLEFARESVQDKIDSVPEFFMVTWLRSASHVLSPVGWSVLFLVLLAVSLGLVLMFLLSTGRGLRQGGFYGAIAAIVLALCCLGFARGQWSDYHSQDAAVVVRPVVSVRSAPGAESSKDLFVLHEGTRVSIVETVGQWHDVELADGRRGWVMVSDVEII